MISGRRDNGTRRLEFKGKSRVIKQNIIPVTMTTENISDILTIISILVVWLLGFYGFYKKNEQNKAKLPYLIKSFNINHSKNLQKENIIKSNSIDLNEIRRILNDSKISKTIFDNYVGSHESLEEIVNVDKKIRSYKKIKNIFWLLSIIILIIAIFILSI